VNYGLIFTAFGVGALAPLIGAWLFDVTKSFTPIFISAGFMTTIGLILCGIIKKKYDLS
jgi:OFA family oxalate/formate antiporter-like MFS transporter